MENSKVAYRMKFSKQGRIRFIGHLDLLNVFQRALKRAALPVAYSQGFNPHQEMSFALPLSLGYYSIGEYVDVDFTEEVEGLRERLNKALPDGLRIEELRRIEPGEKAGASLIRAALYEAMLPAEASIAASHIKELLEAQAVIIEKKGKKKTTEVDIRPDIHFLELKETDQGKLVAMRVAAGSQRNLKAEEVVKYLYKLAGGAYAPHKVSYQRLEMYREKGGEHVPLIASVSRDKK